jgi:acyl-CoA synthetase (AMP-forming)/AMP-acid ligase II
MGVHLGEQIMIEVDTLGDISHAIENKKQSLEDKISPHKEVPGVGRDWSEAAPRLPLVPSDAQTFLDVIEFHVRTHGDRSHVVLHEPGCKDRGLTYRELYAAAQAIGQGLHERRVKTGDAVALMLPTSLDYFICFLGSMLIGAVPVPIYPPMRVAQLEDHMNRHADILNNSGAVALITTPQFCLGVGRMLRLKTKFLRFMESPDTLRGSSKPNAVMAQIASGNLAFLQYTSGSTGSPKGVRD